MPIGQTLLAATPVNPLKLTPHHITASVVDLDRATAWYQRLLGFEIRQRGSHGPVKFVELAIPGFGVALIQEAATAERSAPQQAAAPHWIHIVFTVPDPDLVYRTLKAKGAHLTSRGAANERIESFLVTDSEGNEIEIVGDSPPLFTAPNELLDSIEGEGVTGPRQGSTASSFSLRKNARKPAKTMTANPAGNSQMEVQS